MKWTNKGHEFDHVYENLKKKKSFYLFGAGMYGQAMYEELTKLEVDILGYIDNDQTRQHKVFNGKQIYALDEIELKRDEAIIVCVTPFSRGPIMQQLQIAQYVYNENVFTMEIYMSLKYVYELDKMYISSISFLPSTRCNLNCEACLNFTPYIKHQMIRPLDQVKKDIDIFFSVVDYIMLFHISGGEPFLYPYLKELVTYIGENYRDKIHFLQTVTNGTIELKDDILEVLAKYQVGITIDDYRDAVPEKREAFDKALAQVEKYQLRHDVNKVDKWIDLAPTKTDHSDWNEWRLIKHFESCHEPWQELREGKLYSCNYASYAAVAGLVEENEEENFKLDTYTKNQMKELMEFRLGYNTKGYVEFCKKCAGFVDINPYIVEPAKQKEK
jgi:MoaA/NifB/PqqE/SkfB family radical SAM enzyme